MARETKDHNTATKSTYDIVDETTKLLNQHSAQNIGRHSDKLKRLIAMWLRHGRDNWWYRNADIICMYCYNQHTWPWSLRLVSYNAIFSLYLQRWLRHTLISHCGRPNCTNNVAHLLLIFDLSILLYRWSWKPLCLTAKVVYQYTISWWSNPDQALVCLKIHLPVSLLVLLRVL